MNNVARVLKADPAGRVTLEGVGPVPRPVDIDEAQTGFEALKTLRIYRFAPPGVIHGHAEQDEVFIVILSGEVDLQMRSEQWARSDEHFSLSAPRLLDTALCAAYLPPHAEYELTPRTAADVAYVRALPLSARSPALFASVARRPRAGRAVLLDESSHAERLRLKLLQLDTDATVTDLFDDAPLTGESLIHLRTEPSNAARAQVPGRGWAGLESGDTLVVLPNERACIRLGAHARALALVVSAT